MKDRGRWERKRREKERKEGRKRSKDERRGGSVLVHFTGRQDDEDEKKMERKSNVG